MNLGLRFALLGAGRARSRSLIGTPGNSLSLLSPGAKVAAIGDSILQLGFNSPVAGNQLSGYSVNEVLVALGITPSFRHEIWINTLDTRPVGTPRRFTGANFGVGGDSAAQTKTRLVTNGEAWPCSPDVLIIAVGTNSVSGSGSSGATAASIFADLQAMCEAAMQRGIRAVLAKIRPRGISGSTTVTSGSVPVSWPAADARWAMLADLNALIEDYADPSVRAVWLWDCYTPLADPSPPSGQAGEARANYTNDGVHLAPLGGWYSGKALAETLANIITPTPFISTDPSQSGNYARSPTLTGTGGTKDSNTEGVIADSWRITRLSPTTNLGIKVTGSKEALGSNSRQVFTFDVVDDATVNVTEKWQFQPSTLNISRSGIADDTWYQFWVRCEVNAWAHWRSLAWDFHTRTSAPADETLSVGWQFGTASQEPMLDEAATFWVMTQPLKISSTVANMWTYMTITTKANGASGQGILKVDTPLLIPYGQNPTTYWPSGPIS